MAKYEVYLSDPFGSRLATLDEFHQLSWTRMVNDLGAFTMTFGSEQVDWRLFQPDRRVEVWRVLDTGMSRLVRVYLVRRIERETAEGGQRSVTIAGPDLNDLLARRIVAADAGSAEADKTDHADDMLKAIVREQLGASAGAARDYTANGFSVAPDVSLGPSLTKAFSRRNVLQVCQDVALASYDLGTPLYFDCVSPVPATVEFRTYTERRGADRRNSRTPFSLQRGTLASALIYHDWTTEVNHVYAAGQGVETDREVVEVSDANAIAVSPWNRCEGLADGRVYTTTAGLTSFGRTVLQEKRAARRFQAVLADAPGSRFQLDWDYGDWLSAEYDEEIFNCEVAAVRGQVTPDIELIEAKLEYVG